MNANTKLKLLTVNSITGTTAATIGLVMLPAVQKRSHRAICVTVAVVGIVTTAIALKEIHQIDVAMNKGELQ